MTPYVLATVLVVCLLMAERKAARVRVAAVGLWCSSVAVATLVLYAADWPGSSDVWLNVLWSGVIAASIVWAFAVLRGPARQPAPAVTLTPEPPPPRPHHAVWLPVVGAQ